MCKKNCIYHMNYVLKTNKIIKIINMKNTYFAYIVKMKINVFKIINAH